MLCSLPQSGLDRCHGVLSKSFVYTYYVWTWRGYIPTINIQVHPLFQFIRHHENKYIIFYYIFKDVFINLSVAGDHEKLPGETNNFCS